MFEFYHIDEAFVFNLLQLSLPHCSLFSPGWWFVWLGWMGWGVRLWCGLRPVWVFVAIVGALALGKVSLSPLSRLFTQNW